MRNAVKTVGRLAKETSKTAYKEVRSKWKDMQTVRELEEAGHGQLNHKPRSAPSSPKPSARVIPFIIIHIVPRFLNLYIPFYRKSVGQPVVYHQMKLSSGLGCLLVY